MLPDAPFEIRALEPADLADHKQLHDEALAAFPEPCRCEARRRPLHAWCVGWQPARRCNQDDIAAVKRGEHYLTKDLMVLTLQAE